MRVGTITVDPILDGTATMRAKDLIRPLGDGWAHHPEFESGAAELTLPLGSFLLRVGERKILVDAGVGGIDNGLFAGGALIDSLTAAGVQADEITDVLLTHLHFDHIGWVSRGGVPTFPNATVRCHTADWDCFVEGDDADEFVTRKLTPIRERLELFDSDCSIASGVSIRHAPGHTPGSTIVVLSSGAERALLIGDVAHCPVELTENDWEGVFDMDPVGARKARDQLARELEGTSTRAVGAHFDGLQFGRMVTVGDGRSWQL